MDPTDSANDKIAPARINIDPTTALALLIIAIQIIVAIVTYPFLPDTVPSHWNAAGQVDSYMPKLANALIVPGMSILLFIVLKLALKAGPTLGGRGQRESIKRANISVVNLILNAILLFMLVIQLTIIGVILGMKIDMLLVVSLAESVLFIVLGNYMGKLRRNFWAGIRTPWTLASETVWERTHRMGGWLFVLAGIGGIITSFIPTLRLWGMLAFVGIAVVITVIYSYVLYQRLTVNGDEPLSPPFDDGE